MKVNSTFTKKIEMSASKQLGREVAAFSALCACAGIRNSPKQAKKARGNHYGEYYVDDEGQVKAIPVRQFIWAAVRNYGEGNYNDRIKAIIMRGIHDNPTPHTQVTEAVYEWNVRTGSKVLAGTGKHGTPVFAGRDGYQGFLKKIAEEMSTNQYNAISELNIVGKKHNAESTKRRKGFDHPLEWTHEMENALQGWVARQ